MSTVPKICRLEVSNFGCIGSEKIALDIDKIVILVGPNNAGKSTILRAYEAVTDGLKLSIEDFHNKTVDVNHLPEIIVHSIVTNENKPGDKWCDPIEGSDNFLVKEKWKWMNINSDPIRVGYNINANRWTEPSDEETMPWGVNNVAKSRRPKPHRVNTFDDPDVQTKAITSLLKNLLEDGIKTIKQHDEDEFSKYEKLVDELRELRNSSKQLQSENINALEQEANQIIGQIFPSHSLKIYSPESTAPIKIDLLGDEFLLEMGPTDGTTFPLEKQGSGSRRTALWTILKLLADKGVAAKPASSKAKTYHEKLGPNIAHVLLLDEPEVSLHPQATALARDVLYSLPDNENWQIMIATHSPSFIDLTKDHTTIIRVDKNSDNNIKTTTLFRPDKAQLDNNDKENLKLINLFDSHISEAFFGGRIMIVEGDTEYSAFNYIKQIEKSRNNFEYQDLNIIRARGKVTVASMMKVLNHFGVKYYVLHDTDTPLIISKRKNKKLSTPDLIVYETFESVNPAWTNNNKILANQSENSRVIASIINFEEAYFDETIGSEKPDNCIKHMKEEDDLYNKIKNLLDGILEIEGSSLPTGALVWSKLEDIAEAVTTRLTAVQITNSVTPTEIETNAMTQGTAS